MPTGPRWRLVGHDAEFVFHFGRSNGISIPVLNSMKAFMSRFPSCSGHSVGTSKTTVQRSLQLIQFRCELRGPGRPTQSAYGRLCS